MNVTAYYSRILEIQGQQPNLSFEQHKKMFNIVAFEIRFEELKRIEHLLQDPDLQRKIHLRDSAVREQLATLTKHDHAANLSAKMIEAS